MTLNFSSEHVCFAPPPSLSNMVVFNLLPVAEWHVATVPHVVNVWPLLVEMSDVIEVDDYIILQVGVAQ